MPGRFDTIQYSKQEAQLSPRDPRDALYLLKYCSTVIRMTQRYHLLAEEHVQQLSRLIPLYLHSVVHVSFHYRTASMQCRGCHQQTSVPMYNHTTNCADVDWTVTVIIRFRLVSELNVDDTACSSASAPSCMRITVADGHKFWAVR